MRVIEFLTVRGDGDVLKSKVDTDHGPCRRHRGQVYILAVDSNIVYPTFGLLYSRRKDFSLDLLADAAIHVADFREPNALPGDSDGSSMIVLCLETWNIPFLGFELWVANTAASLEPSKEVFVGPIEVFKRRLQRGRIHFFEPRKFLLKSCKLLTALFIRKARSGFLVGGLSPIQEAIEHISAIPKGLSHQFFLCFCRIESKSVAIFHLCVHLPIRHSFGSQYIV